MQRRRFSRHISTLVALVLALGATSVPAQSAPPGPLDRSGEIAGAPYRIVVPDPAKWNGTLLVFAHGHRDKADHPGEVDDRSVELAPTPALETRLLEDGYALAGTAYRSNGWAVEEGLEDVRALASYFRDTVARPAYTILWGTSMGTVITLETAERGGGLFDGYLAACTVGAGAPRGVADGAVALRLAYDVAFGMPRTWGTPGDVRDDLDFESEVLPVLVQQATAENFKRFEFIRLVVGVPGSGITPDPGYFPSAWFSSFYFATEVLAELERRAAGPVGQNLNHAYRLTATEAAYLSSLGIDAGALLGRMNARRSYTAPAEPRNYVEHFADYTGAIKAPVLTLHTRIDQVTPVSHEAAYRSTVQAAGRADRLVQLYTTGTRHCRFTTEQGLTAVTAINDWVRTGEPPEPGNFDAAVGFIPGFEPPAWPQP